jgi:hypothetical protein
VSRFTGQPQPLFTATPDCWQGQVHLLGVIRPDGSRHCARCDVELLPADAGRAWGSGLEAMPPDKALKTGPGRPTAGTATGSEGRGKQ